MPYILGIDLGTSRTAAAVWRNGRADTVPLSDHTATMPSMIFVRDDQSLLVGEAARRRGPDDPARLAREFKRRFGDSAPLVLGAASLTAEQLTAALLRHVVEFVSQREGGKPDRVVVTHPANWGTYRRDLLRNEALAAGITSAQLISEPDAAAVHHASSERVGVGEVIAVYDLGGGTFDATVLRRSATGFEQVGEPKGVERLGGVDFDEAMFHHVLSAAGIDADDIGDDDLGNLLRLRDDCQTAKETLSDDDQATVLFTLTGRSYRVMVTRRDFEQLIRPSLLESVHCLRTAIVDSGIPVEKISAVLMVGGSSRIPLARRLISDQLALPVVLISNPKEAVALGAARLGAGSPVTPPVEPPVTPPVAPPSAAPPTVASAPSAPRRTVEVAPAATRPPRSRTPLLIAAGLGTAALLIGGIVLANGDDDGDSSNETSVTVDISDISDTTDAEAPITGAETTAATSSTAPSTTATTSTTPPTEPPPPAPPSDLYAVVPTVDLTLVPEALIPPLVQTDPIPNGFYFGQALLDGDGVVLSLDELLMGSACIQAAETRGEECTGFFTTAVGYVVPILADAQVSVNNGDLETNLAIDVAELRRLLDGLPPSVDVGEFVFNNLFIARVENGRVIRLEGFFTS